MLITCTNEVFVRRLYFVGFQPSIYTEVMNMFNMISVESSSAYNKPGGEEKHGFRFVFLFVTNNLVHCTEASRISKEIWLTYILVYLIFFYVVMINFV